MQAFTQTVVDSAAELIACSCRRFHALDLLQDMCTMKWCLVSCRHPEVPALGWRTQQPGGPYSWMTYAEVWQQQTRSSCFALFATACS